MSERQLAAVGRQVARRTRAELKPGGTDLGVDHAISSFLDQRVFDYAPNLRLLTAPWQVARAHFERPGEAIPNTLKGFAELLAGAPAAIGQGVVDTAVGAWEGDPLRGARRFAELAAEDYKRRYGDLLAGNSAAFRERVIEEGGAAELADFAAVGAGQGTLLGRGAGAAARRGALGSAAQQFATDPRPLLRLSGDIAREQELGRNIFRLGGQRLEDRLRSARVARGDRRAKRDETPVEALRPGPGEVVPLRRGAARKAQRVDVSRVKSRAYIANRHEQTAELTKGAERDLARLPKKAQRAVFHAMQGLVPLADPAAARRWIERRRDQIVARRVANGISLEEARVLRPTSEMRALQFLHEHANDIFTPRLAEFHARNLERSKRLEAADPALRSETALVRRYRPQGDLLGVPYRYEVAVRQIEDALAGDRITAEQAATARAQLDEKKPALDRQYLAEVRAAATNAGLPEPAYVLHQPRPFYSRADRTVGVAKAVQGVRKSDLKLFREGRANTDPKVFIQGLAKNIKRKHQWTAVADIFDRHTFPWSRNKTPAQIRKTIDEKGLRPEDVALVDLGRFRRVREGTLDDTLDVGEHPALAAALRDSVIDPERLRVLEQEGGQKWAAFLKTRGFSAVPKEVAEELLADTRPTGAALRIVSKIQGFQSAAILGLSPSWLQMQIAANTLLTGFGTHGNLPDMLKSQGWWRKLSPEQKRRYEQHLNIGVFEAHTQRPRLGAAADGRLVSKARDLAETKFVHALARANPYRVVTTTMFRLDDAQNRAFRRAVLYNAAKREAFARIRKEAGRAAEAQARVSNLLRVAPGETLALQVARVLDNPKDIERLGEHVDRVLGDFVRYTAKERRQFKPFVMFYGFLRFSLRTLLYTLPVRHPLASAITAKLSQLHREEVKQLLGGDEAPWAFSRIFFEKNGELRSIDLARINPVTSPLTNAIEEGPKAFAGVASPMVQAIADQIYGQSVFSGRRFRVGGSAAENPRPDAVTRARIMLNQLLSIAYPYREAHKVLNEGTQGDDSLLWDPRPLKYKTADALRRERERRVQRGAQLEQLLQDTFPLAFPKPDNSRKIAASRRGDQSASDATKASGLLDARDVELLRRAAQGGGALLDQRDIELLRRAAGR